MTSLLNIAGNIPVVEAGGQSLRFEDGDSAYLSWTPASAGNRKTWTWSGWVKRGNLTTTHNTLFMGRSSPVSNAVGIVDNQVRFYSYNGSGFDFQKKSNAVLRDPSAWYHIVAVFDSSNATASDRAKIYINGERVTSFASSSDPSLNFDGQISNNVQQTLGQDGTGNEIFDGYLANVTFIDGTALTPTSFGEYDDTLWKPKSDADIQSLTFGTNGFYLPFKQTTEAEGFSTVTYTGNGGTQSIEGVGFEPDLVWLKGRTTAYDHQIYDSVRGATERLRPSLIEAESTQSTGLTSFDSSGFTLGSLSGINNSSNNYVAWCWDAGSGSAVSNTDGTITSSVKANTAKGFSIATYTGDGTSGSTFGHGLGVVPELIIVKRRNGTSYWNTYTSVTGATKYLELVTTATAVTATNRWNNTAPTSSVVTLGNTSNVNGSGSTYVAYSFASVSGYSSIGSYTGTGATGNKITTGFKPAFVMVKSYDQTRNWIIWDNTRTPTNPADGHLHPNSSVVEQTGSDEIQFDSDGFTFLSGDADSNTSGFNYIYMAFADTRDATFFGDTSGNGNNWTPNALNNTDVVPDSPVTGGNFATMNPLWQTLGTVTHSEGNLKTTVGANAHQAAVSTFTIPSTGKWYWEMRLDSKTYSTYTYGYGGVGATTGSSNSGDPSNWVTDGTRINWRFPNSATYNKVYGSGSINLFGATDQFADEDIISFAYDADNKRLYLAQNGSWFLSADPSTNTGDSTAVWYGWSDAVAGTHQFFEYWGYFTYVTSKNFGQDSSFIGQVTPQGNTDDNGVGDFYYAPPSGYLALTTGNLPAATITAPDDYFNTVLWTNGVGQNQSPITGVGFQPDLVWIKLRDAGTNHVLTDAVRGATKTLESNTTNAETTETDGLTAFNSDGFALGNDTRFNSDERSMVAWNWLASNNTVSNTDGSITSTVSANQTAGFSVVGYVGNGSSSQTVGHGLGSVSDPSLLIVKNRDQTDNWIVRMNVNGTNKFLFLDSTSSGGTSSVSLPTTDVFGVGTSGYDNTSGENYIAYLFSSVSGYSKIGSFTGNGSADGTFVHCGFRPAWVIMKRTDSTGNWFVYDSKRPEYNSPYYLLPNTSFGGDGTDNPIDFLSNGFKLKTAGGGTNVSSGTYIFIALAEAPFKSANAR